MTSPTTRFTLPFRRSLRHRLPLVASVLIAAVLSAFLWVAFREVESALVQAGGARAQGVASQLASLLSESAQQRLRDVQRVARHSTIRGYLREQNDSAANAAREELRSLTAQGQPAIELWNSKGQQLLVVSRTAAGTETSGSPAAPPLPAAAPATPGLTPFHLVDGVIHWDATSEVSSDDGVEPSKSAPLGFVVSRRLLSTTSTSDFISRLVGNGAVVMLGNQGGDVWSDLSKVVPAPPVETGRAGQAEYRSREGHDRIGASAPIHGTPWAVWVEFPRAVVVAPIWRFLSRMSLFGLFFIVTAAFMARALSQRITQPLNDLTEAAEAIAAGKTHQRVAIERPDEIGRLGAAFNEMAEQVRSVQSELEARVEQRTASLAQAEARTKEILRTANDAFVGMDAAGRIVNWNTQAEKIFGWSSEQAIGRALAEVIIPEDRTAERRELERQVRISEGGPLNRRFEVESWRRNGDQFPVEITIWASGTGDDQAFHAFVRDITDRKRAEKAVSDAKTEAERASQAKNEFLSRMSHDLRTPLNAILGFAQLLEMDRLPPEQLESVQLILKGGKHLLELINEVLDISRIEAGQLSLSAEPVDVRDVVHHAVDLIAPLAGSKNIAVEVADLPGDGWTVVADRQRLTQVLLNLLSNAIKYNRVSGRVTIAFEEAPDGRLRIKVHDTGAGIPPEKLARLFRPFERLGAETTAIEGTGLGLALSRGLAAAMGGSLGVASEVDRGSTFWVELQRAAPADPLLADAPSRLDMSDTSRVDGTVLYVEDNLANVRLMERVFERRPNVALVHAATGASAIATAIAIRPQVVFLDLHLPDMDGAEVLRRLQENRELRTVPVVVLSADATPDQARRLKASGAKAYLTKPLDLSVVLQMLDDLLVETRKEHTLTRSA